MSRLGDLLHRMRALGGGGMAGYFDDGSRVSPPASTETPFLKALQIVDRRDGHARQLAATWKTATIGMTVVAALLAAGWFREARKASIEWLVVPVDRFGEPGEISAPAAFEPTQAMLAERAEEVVKAAFSLSVDAKVNAGNYEFLKATLRGNAIRAWTEWWKATRDNPPEERVVRVLTVKPTASAKTVNVIWQELDYRESRVVAQRRINGDLTIEHIAPHDRGDAWRNKLGLFVTNFLFAPEGRQ